MTVAAYDVSFENESDDPWAEPKAEVVVEEPVDVVEITYLDPKSGEVCQRDVFCEAEDWKFRYISRLLVSADLVNSLSEAQATWHGRFRDIHRRLENSRVAFYHELMALRAFIKRLTDFTTRPEEPRSPGKPAKPAEDTSENERTGTIAHEVCPVHFYLPECYLDGWTIERRDNAIETFTTELKAEIKDISDRIELLGGGTWRQLLSYFMRKGHGPVVIAEDLMKVVTDPEEKRYIENTLTDGLRDKYDRLEEIVRDYAVEEKDMTRRQLEVYNKESRLEHTIEQLRKRLKELLEKLAEPEPEEPPEDPSKLAAATDKLFAELAEKLEEAKQGVENLKAQLEALLANPPDDEETQKLEKEAKAAERRLRLLEIRTERTDTKTAECNERIAAILERIANEREQIAELREKLLRLPPPTNEALLMKRMQRQIRKLKAEDAEIQKAMIKPTNRIRAMRAQLRELYKKLGWEWDLSDSEAEDEEEKPYWKRRQIAADGFLPFDPRGFVYAEKDIRNAKQERREQQRKADEESKYLSQMKASNRYHEGDDEGKDDGAETKPSDEASASQPGVMLFGTLDKDNALGVAPGDSGGAVSSDFRSGTRGGTRGGTRNGARSGKAQDSVEHAISSARERLAGSRASRRAPTQAQLLQEERWNAQLLQLQKLRGSFEAQLRQCVECFIDLLPPHGVLGDLRSQLLQMLVHLQGFPSDAAALIESNADQQIEQACALLQATMEEVITYGDSVHPICAAMIHSVSFGELRRRLSKVLQIERDISENLKASRIMRDAKRQLVRSGSSHANAASKETTLEPGAAKGAERSSPASSPRPQPVSLDSAHVEPPSAPGSPKSPLLTRSPRFDSGSSPETAGLEGSLSVGSRNSASPPPGPLKLPPRLLASSEALLSSQSKPRRRRPSGRPQVDFGFRPDGSGEDSLENWSLFKVSKGAGKNDATASTGFGLNAGTTFLSEKLKRTDSKVRHHRGPVECDFHEYMAQNPPRSNDASWMSASTPSLGSTFSDRKKRCPSLPQLIKKPAAGQQHGSATPSASKDQQFGSWSRGIKRIDEYTRSFGTT